LLEDPITCHKLKGKLNTYDLKKKMEMKEKTCGKDPPPPKNARRHSKILKQKLMSTEYRPEVIDKEKK